MNAAEYVSVGALSLNPLVYFTSLGAIMMYLWMFFYVASIVLANLTLDRFIDMGPLGLLSIGTLFFACVFTLRDKLHTFGLKTVIIGITIALLVNIALALSIDMPPRFIMASFISILLSEVVDTGIYQQLSERAWWLRALSSNMLSIPLDAIFFSLLAFYGSMSMFDIAQIIWADIIFKTIIASLLIMMIMHHIHFHHKYILS
jgi:uncharacterized PurR-regulated membrane protein YhhQ (DUF165 family)